MYIYIYMHMSICEHVPGLMGELDRAGEVASALRHWVYVAIKKNRLIDRYIDR